MCIVKNRLTTDTTDKVSVKKKLDVEPRLSAENPIYSHTDTQLNYQLIDFCSARAHTHLTPHYMAFCSYHKYWTELMTSRWCSHRNPRRSNPISQRNEVARLDLEIRLWIYRLSFWFSRMAWIITTTKPQTKWSGKVYTPLQCANSVFVSVFFSSSVVYVQTEIKIKTLYMELFWQDPCLSWGEAVPKPDATTTILHSSYRVLWMMSCVVFVPNTCFKSATVHFLSLLEKTCVENRLPV